MLTVTVGEDKSNTQPRLTYPSTFTDLNLLTRSLSTLLSKTGFKG
jgi:hypothetical protein